MSTRKQKWIIHERSSGKWDLSRNTTSFYSGVDTKAEIIRRLKSHFRPGERVFLESPEGDRLNVTEQLRHGGFL